MNQPRTLRQLAGFIPLFLAASVFAQQAKNLEEVMSYDGLQRIDIKGIDMAYALPGATMSGYSKVMIDPISVRFHKDWKPKVAGSTRNLSAGDQQMIRENVAKIVYNAFVEELKKGGLLRRGRARSGRAARGRSDHQSLRDGAGCDDAWTNEGLYGISR